MPAMRAKVKCTKVTLLEAQETVEFSAVIKSGYPPDGLDEDNTFARFTPSATFSITVTNPSLLGQFRPNQKYYVDFTPVPEST